MTEFLLAQNGAAAIDVDAAGALPNANVLAGRVARDASAAQAQLTAVVPLYTVRGGTTFGEVRLAFLGFTRSILMQRRFWRCSTCAACITCGWSATKDCPSVS